VQEQAGIRVHCCIALLLSRQRLALPIPHAAARTAAAAAVAAQQ
jgi:hypothetical protein